MQGAVDAEFERGGRYAYVDNKPKWYPACLSLPYTPTGAVTPATIPSRAAVWPRARIPVAAMAMAAAASIRRCIVLVTCIPE